MFTFQPEKRFTFDWNHILGEGHIIAYSNMRDQGNDTVVVGGGGEIKTLSQTGVSI